MFDEVELSVRDDIVIFVFSFDVIIVLIVRLFFDVLNCWEFLRIDCSVFDEVCGRGVDVSCCVCWGIILLCSSWFLYFE